MPVLYLDEEQVKQVLTMDMAIDAVDAVLRKMALEEAFAIPRSRCQTDHTSLHVLSASAKSLGVIGLKAYTKTKTVARYHITIYDGKTGEMTAFMQADHLGQMRTGAASAVASKYLARSDSKRLGLYGSGKQAKTQAIGVCRTLNIERITVHSPNEERLSRFVEDLVALGLPAIGTANPEEAARGQDIICTATTSKSPILHGDWIAPGTHLNIIGANYLSKSEVDLETIRKANLLTIDSKEQGRLEAGDFSAALDAKIISWPEIHDIGRVIAGRTEGRQKREDITLFKSLGLGLEDIAVAQRVYLRAKEMNIGSWLDL